MSPGHSADLQQKLGIALPHITAAQVRTAELLAARRKQLTTLVHDPDAAVVLMGSFGRREVTSTSDDDYLVLLSGEPRQQAQPQIAAVAASLGASPPGRQGVFGEQVWLGDLREIGLDDDTNNNLTRRMLLILESVAVSGEQVHAGARRSLLERYLSAGAKDYRPPRFFLNDLVRYWRTIAVDFEGKMHARSGEGWGLRNAKLMLSRKALFASGLLPLLECGQLPRAAMLDYLDERMAKPPLERIAGTFIAKGAIDPGRRALGAYDQFLGILGDPDKRAQLAALGPDDAKASPLFRQLDELGNSFQQGLLALLFDSRDLHEWVREYLIF